ncbi:MAG: hypothetical protein ABI822_11285 [Bryobacteraceae bacterium]
MNQELLLYTMTGFVIVSAVALCVQAALLFGIYKSSKAVQEQAASLMPQAKAFLGKADKVLEENRLTLAEVTRKVNEIADKANQMMDIGKAQLVKIDAVITDASGRALVQLERAEMVVDDTVTRVHDSVAAVHNGLLKPVREVQGVATGVKTAISVFLRGGRPSVAQATQDDEMFI